MIATILFFWWPSVAITPVAVEFNSPAACEAAASEIEQRNPFSSVTVFCVPKG